MIKRKASFALVMLLVIVGLLVAMFPASTMAAPGIVEVNWSESAFEGYDSFYGTNVVAYTAGATAKMEFRVRNDGTADLTIRAAVATFDWGTCTPTVPATFPFVLKAGESAIFRFECAVPADATNQTLHNYKAEVHYEGMNGPTVVNRVTWEDAGDQNLNNDVAVPGSVVLWDVTSTGAQVIPVDKYSISYITGAITWVAPYTGPTGSLYAAYEYISTWTFGNGSNTVFRFEPDAADRPIVADSVKVVKRIDAPVSSVTKIDTGWTVDLATGTVTFTTAPAAYEQVGVFYKNYNSFITSGSNLAVISADQESYNTNWRRYNETYNTYWLNITSGEALRLGGAAEQARAQAEIEYREGNFAEANATMQTALTNLNAAIAAEATYQEAISDGVVGLLTGGGTVIDAYGAKLNAEATNITELTDAQVKKLKGEASKATNTGIFYIMLGVFTLLVGIAAVLWGLGQFMGARSPKAQGP